MMSTPSPGAQAKLLGSRAFAKTASRHDNTPMQSTCRPRLTCRPSSVMCWCSPTGHRFFGLYAPLPTCVQRWQVEWSPKTWPEQSSDQ